MSDEQEVVAAEGSTPNQETWTLLYRPADGQHGLRLLVNGREHEAASGFDFEVTEIGFAAGLKPGCGHYFLYGLVTSRIRVVRAESQEAASWSDVTTAPLPSPTACDLDALRMFVMVRPPIDDVSALVGLDRAGQEVQRIPFL